MWYGIWSVSHVSKKHIKTMHDNTMWQSVLGKHRVSCALSCVMSHDCVWYGLLQCIFVCHIERRFECHESRSKGDARHTHSKPCTMPHDTRRCYVTYDIISSKCHRLVDCQVKYFSYQKCDTQHATLLSFHKHFTTTNIYHVTFTFGTDAESVLHFWESLKKRQSIYSGHIHAADNTS